MKSMWISPIIARKGWKVGEMCPLLRPIMPFISKNGSKLLKKEWKVGYIYTLIDEKVVVLGSKWCVWVHFMVQKWPKKRPKSVP